MRLSVNANDKKSKKLLQPYKNYKQLGLFKLNAVLYFMKTFQATIKTQINKQLRFIKTEVRALNVQDARMLLWAQYGFLSIQAGPYFTKVTKS